jgi:histidine ammonia-lyase
MSDQVQFLLSDAPISIAELQSLIADKGIYVVLADAAKAEIDRCRTYLDQKMAQNDEAIYGINTGFGALRDKRIDDEHLGDLQYNLMRSHACGAGAEVPGEIVRLMLLLKARSLAYGHSGVQVATVERLLDFYNHDILPVVYTQGSLGASGDLAPLAHLSLPIIGEGEVWLAGERMPAAEMLQRKGWAPLRLQSKEGLALLNGTQFMLAYGIHMLVRAQRLADAADQLAALSLDAFDGRLDPFHPRLHEIRPHAGQIQVAANVRAALQGSELIHQPKSDVQDPYSLRCVPQVHGASRDAIAFCAQTLLTEANSTTDNPNIFVEEDLILSGGNFHGQPLAIALDLMAIALAELGAISERRVYLLQAGKRGLSPFLAVNPGLESGLMIAQYTAAAIASQNKQLCSPAVVDSIPSSNGQEDHVSMGANAAVKCLQVLENVTTLLGIELMHASQALSFRSPAKTGNVLEKVLAKFRQEVPLLTTDRLLQPDIAAARRFVSAWIPEQNLQNL